MTLNAIHTNDAAMKVTRIKKSTEKMLEKCEKNDNLAVGVMAASMLMAVVFAAMGEQVLMAVSGFVMVVALGTMLYGWIKEDGTVH